MTLRLNKFCFCCTTKTGALVIGTLGWILTLIQIFSMMDPNHAAEEEQLKNAITNHLIKETEGTSSQDDIHYFRPNIYLKIGYALISFIICVLLIMGVYRKDKRLILPWLVLKGFEVIIITILVIIAFFIACIGAQGLLFVLFIILLALSALHWYFWLCVWSHYTELSEGNVINLPPMYNSPEAAPPQYMEKSQYGNA